MNNTIQLFGFQKGVLGKYSNHLAWPTDALADGSNVELSNGGLESRRGYLFHSDQTNPSSKLPAGTVKVLQQVRFPTRGSTFLIAQVDTGTANKLYYCKADLQIDGDASWTELYDMGSGAGTVSSAVLGDRVIFTEGVNKPPLVWGGSVETDGSDWQTPKNVVLSWDDLNYHDATNALTDPDGTTVEAIGGMGTGDPPVGAIYVCLDQAKCSGLYINMGTVSTDASPSWQYWDGTAWTDLSNVTDGTAGLTQDGIVTFDEVTLVSTLVADLPGFWIRIAPITETASGATIAEIRFKAPCQILQNLGDGLPDIPMACMWRDNSIGSVHEIAPDLSDYTPNTYQLLNDGNPDTSLAEPFESYNDHWYIGYVLQFSAVEIEINGNYPNENTETMVVEYWNGTDWATISGLVDGTDESGVPLNHKGKITWTMPTDWKMCRPLSHQYPLGYYISISFGVPI